MAQSSDAENRLFITKIPQSVDKNDVQEHFGAFGQLTDVYMPSVPGQAGHKGIAFVSFAHSESLKVAISYCPHELQGREVVVDIAAAKGSQKGSSNAAPTRSPRVFSDAPNVASSEYQQSTQHLDATPGTQEESRLFVTKIPQELTREHLRAHFAQFGDLTDVYMPVAPGQNSHKGMCFVSFQDNTSVQLALGQVIHEVWGHEVVVDIAAPRGGQSGGNSAAISGSKSAAITMAQYSGMSGMSSYGAADPYAAAAMQAMYNPAAVYAQAAATMGQATRGGAVQGRLFVTRVPPEIYKEDLQAYFSQFGALTDCFVPNGGKGIAYVSFQDPSSAESVLTNREHEVKAGKIVCVEQALDRGARAPGGSAPSLSPATAAGTTGTPVQGRLFVTRISPEIYSEDLQAYFSQFGALTDCFVPNGGKGIAYISFQDPSSAGLVLQSREHQVKSGMVVCVEQALDRRPLGGKGGDGKGFRPY